MPLLTAQRALLRLVRELPAEDGDLDDEYVRRVAASPRLALVREIGTWWSEFAIEDWCPLTAALLRQRGRFAPTVHEFCAKPGRPSESRALALELLEWLEGDADRLVASVAAFESALHVAWTGLVDRRIPWDHEPTAVLAALIDGTDVDAGATGSWHTRVASDLPQLFEISRQQ